MKRSFALTEAGAVGRRPRRAFEVFWRKTLMEGPSQKVFKNGGWLCLTDAQRYYTTLQFWQVTGSADGAVQNGGEFSATSGQPHGLRARRPRSQGRFPKSGLHPRQMGCIQDIWRASRPILSATRGAGETPAIPGGYATISDAPACIRSSKLIGLRLIPPAGHRPRPCRRAGVHPMPAQN